MDIVIEIIKYGILPLLTGVCAVGWHMYKKIEARMENLESRTNDVERTLIEIKTAFSYVSRDIQEIKEMLHKMSDAK